MTRFWHRQDDHRSRRAIAIDKAKQAMMVYPRTQEGIRNWRKHKGHADLQGYDISHKTRQLNMWEAQRHKRSMFENVPTDLFDWYAYTDSTLTHKENISNIRHMEKDYMRGIL